MWRNKNVSVVLMTYAERASIRQVIEGFESTGVVDEIIVVDNNAEAGTAAEVAKTRARRVLEPRQGYGSATRRGLAEASGDVVVLCEPDGTFVAQDIVKLLSYSDEFDVVFGTRTLPSMVREGANMGRLLRWGNWAVAKLITVLFGAQPLTDVGCTYKLLSREAVDRVLPGLKVTGNELSPELMLKVILANFTYVEIPVNYLPRVGESSVTGHLGKAAALGIRMILLILRIRLATLLRGGALVLAPPALHPSGHTVSRPVIIPIMDDRPTTHIGPLDWVRPHSATREDGVASISLQRAVAPATYIAVSSEPE